MMLQGHFIDTLLAIEYRDPDNIAYSTWLYFRGITAPVFFTISGLPRPGQDVDFSEN